MTLIVCLLLALSVTVTSHPLPDLQFNSHLHFEFPGSHYNFTLWTNGAEQPVCPQLLTNNGYWVLKNETTEWTWKGTRTNGTDCRLTHNLFYCVAGIFTPLSGAVAQNKKCTLNNTNLHGMTFLNNFAKRGPTTYCIRGNRPISVHVQDNWTFHFFTWKPGLPPKGWFQKPSFCPTTSSDSLPPRSKKDIEEFNKLRVAAQHLGGM